MINYGKEGSKMGGGVKFYPYKKGGGEAKNVLAMHMMKYFQRWILKF